MRDGATIMQCEACGVDYLPDNPRGAPSRFCKTQRCRSDRQAEATAKYIEKIPRKPGYGTRYSYREPSTKLPVNTWRARPRKGRSEGESA